MRSSYWLIGIIVIGFLLRLISLNQSLWLDEATSVLVAREMPFFNIITEFSPGDFHPPLYYLLLKAWINFFGSTEIAVRMLSVLFSVGTVGLMWEIGRKQFSKKVGVLAALFLATAPLHIYYSQEARMYVVETFFATLLLLLFANFLKKQSLKISLGLIIVSSLLLYTDYFPGFLLCAFVIYLLLFERKHLSKLFPILIGLMLVYLPWLPTLFKQISLGSDVKETAPLWFEVLGRTDLKQLALVQVKFIIGRISFYDKTLYAIYVLSALSIFITPLIDTYKSWHKNKLIWFCFLIPIGLAAIFGAISSGFSYFRLLFVLPTFYLLVAVGVQNINSKVFKKVTIALIFLVNLISTFIYLLNPTFHRENWRDAVAYVEDNSQGDAVSIFVTNNQRDPHIYYAKKVLSYGPQILNEELPGKIWLFRYVQPIFDPRDSVRAKIESMGYAKQQERDFNGITVWEYQR